MFSYFLNTFQQFRQGNRENFIDWARVNATMFSSLDGSGTDVEKLACLDELLAGKRIVYLGEEDHWIHEKNEYRLLFLRYLFSRGWRFVGEELGWSDGGRIDRYLETGDRLYLDRIATYGYRGDLRTDRLDRPTEILKDSWDHYPEKTFAAAQLRMIEILRKLNANRPPGTARLHFFGFDIDAVAGGGYEDAKTILSDLPNDTIINRVCANLARIPGETLAEEIERLDGVLRTIDLLQADLEERLDMDRTSNLRQCIKSLRDSLHFNRVAHPARDWKSLNRAMADREEAMFRHVKFVLTRMKPVDKLVLMGHNRHLSKEMGAIKDAGAAPPGGKLVPSLGSFLHRLFPGQVFSIWMLHERGISSQPFTNLSSEYHQVPGSLNDLLAKVGDGYILPTCASDPRSKILWGEMKIVGLYNVIFRTAIARQADAIFFTREVGPLHF